MSNKLNPKKTSFYSVKFLRSKKPFQTRVKPAPKPNAKKAPQKRPNFVNAMHEQWFFNLSAKQFSEMCWDWNIKNLKIKVPKQDDYDEWFNYFKTIPASHTRMLVNTGQDILSTEAYSALRRWHDIVGNPHRIEKIHQSGLTSAKNKDGVDSITKLAQDNDRLGVLKATRDRIAEKLQKGAGARDTAALAREMTEIMTQIADYEKRQGPKKDTVLGSLLHDAEELKKRPSKSGGGARKNSFKSRITIEDVEGKNNGS